MDYELATSKFEYNPETGAFTHKTGPLTGNKAGWVDRGGYVRLWFKNRQIGAHRIAWLLTYGEYAKNDIDHIDGDPSNNRISNLRDVSHAVNTQNLKAARSHNKSTGVLGVIWNNFAGKYQARIGVNKKSIHLGYYKTVEEAQAAYLAAKRKLHEGCTI